MGFFTKAVVAALKDLPNVNAEIEGDNIIYKNYYDIGIAVSTERGLVVPVVRDADHLSLAGIEKAIGDFGLRARDNKLKLEELQGGTFSITNGGVFGSLMSTPLPNSPQSGALEMPKITPHALAASSGYRIRLDLRRSVCTPRRACPGECKRIFPSLPAVDKCALIAIAGPTALAVHIEILAGVVSGTVLALAYS